MVFFCCIRLRLKSVYTFLKVTLRPKWIGRSQDMQVKRHGHVLFVKNVFRYIHIISPVTNFLVNFLIP